MKCRRVFGRTVSLIEDEDEDGKLRMNETIFIGNISNDVVPQTIQPYCV